MTEHYEKPSMCNENKHCCNIKIPETNFTKNVKINQEIQNRVETASKVYYKINNSTIYTEEMKTTAIMYTITYLLHVRCKF